MGQKLVGPSPHVPIRPDGPAHLAIKLIDSAYAIDGSFTRATIHQLRPVNTGTPLGRPRRTAATMPPTRRAAAVRQTGIQTKHVNNFQTIDSGQYARLHFLRHTHHTDSIMTMLIFYDKERSYIIPNPNDNYKVVIDLFCTKNHVLWAWFQNSRYGG